MSKDNIENEDAERVQFYPELEADRRNLIELNDMLNFIQERKTERGIKQKGGKLYTVVADRVEALRRFGGLKYRIETELLGYDGLNPDKPVLMRATIRDQQGNILSVGHAEEWRDEGYVNKTSAVENAETSAIGRALAGLGLHGGEYASINEIEIATAKQDHKASEASPGTRKRTPKAEEPKPEVTITVPVETGTKLVDVEIPQSQGMKEGETIYAIVKQFLPACESVSALMDFWKANSKPLADLKDRDPKAFDEVRTLFTERKNTLQEN